MKELACLLSVILTANLSLQGGPLKRDQVSPEAKWLLHLDCENLRQTKVGEYLLKQFVDKQAAAAGQQLNFDVSAALQKVTALTAYGTEYSKTPDKTGVLLVQADAETQKAVEGLLAAQMLADEDGPVEKLEANDGKDVTYSIKNEIFISPQPGGAFLVGKSQQQLEKARAVLTGKTPNPDSAKLFADFPNVQNGFFFLGLAEGFNDANLVPPQAKCLQMADGGRLVLGENAAQVFLNLALKGKTAEVTKQIQQVMEGMVALVTLGQPDNKELVELAQSTKVSSADQLVMINLEYPADRAIERLNQQNSPAPKKAKKAKKSKPAKAPASEPKAEADEQATDAPAPKKTQ